MILDSNLIIYAAKPEHAALRQFIAQHAPAVSAVSKVEVLGYHKLTEEERVHFEAFFAAAEVLSVSQEVIDQAVRLRQTRKMTLGDALIAATALAYSRTLLTHNVADFTWVPGLVVVDPLEAEGAP
jgi:toxin FitB